LNVDSVDVGSINSIKIVLEKNTKEKKWIFVDTTWTPKPWVS